MAEDRPDLKTTRQHFLMAAGVYRRPGGEFSIHPAELSWVAENTPHPSIQADNFAHAREVAQVVGYTYHPLSKSLSVDVLWGEQPDLNTYRVAVEFDVNHTLKPGTPGRLTVNCLFITTRPPPPRISTLCTW